MVVSVGDLLAQYVVEVLKYPASCVSGCGLVSNLIKGSKSKKFHKYFEEIPGRCLEPGDVVIWEYGHVALYDMTKNNLKYYFSQNPNKCKVMTIERKGKHYFKAKEKIKKYEVTATKGLNVREKAGTNSKIVKTLKYKTKIDVIKYDKSWSQTKDGYICSDYIKEVK